MQACLVHKKTTYQVACGFDCRVVLDFPQAFIKAFPLVRRSKCVLVFLVGQKILWAQECSVRGGRHLALCAAA